GAAKYRSSAATFASGSGTSSDEAAGELSATEAELSVDAVTWAKMLSGTDGLTCVIALCEDFAVARPSLRFSITPTRGGPISVYARSGAPAPWKFPAASDPGPAPAR